MGALALFDTVEEFLPQASVTLKWPNDVLVDSKKISGILLESGAGWLCIGMGLNVSSHPDNGLYPSTSLQAAGALEIDLEPLLEKLLVHLRHWYEVMQQDGFEPIRAAWLKRAQKGQMSVRLPQETLIGIFADLDRQGNLQLRLANGTERSIAIGDVFLVAKE
jgi:BirA family biotin operon repressor/biotin-[acetyl-CoA-carboxylase] ligase